MSAWSIGCGVLLVLLVPLCVYFWRQIYRPAKTPSECPVCGEDGDWIEIPGNEVICAFCGTIYREKDKT